MTVFEEKRDWFVRGCVAVFVGSVIGTAILVLGLSIGHDMGVLSAGQKSVQHACDEAEINASDAHSNLPRIIYKEAEPYRGKNHAQYF